MELLFLIFKLLMLIPFMGAAMFTLFIVVKSLIEDYVEQDVSGVCIWIGCASALVGALGYAILLLINY